MSQKRGAARYKGIVRGAAPFSLLMSLLAGCTPSAAGGPNGAVEPADMRFRTGAAESIAHVPASGAPGHAASARNARASNAGSDASLISTDTCKSAAGMPRVALPPLSTARAASRDNLQSWVNLLAGSALRGRRAGTDDSRRTAALLADQFRKFGAQPPSENGYCASFEDAQLRDQNVVAHIPPARAECPWIVVGAHYDALGTDKGGVMYPGADDNASGVSVLMELARLVQAGVVKPKVGLALVAFGAEEAGLTGSKAYVGQPSVPLSKVDMMINVDMAGRKPAGYPIVGYEVYGRGKARSSHRVRMAAASAKTRAVPAQLGDRSDSASFAPHVPTVFLCTMVHADYHKPSDTPDRVDYEQTLRTLRLLTALVENAPCSPTEKP